MNPSGLPLKIHTRFYFILNVFPKIENLAICTYLTFCLFMYEFIKSLGHLYFRVFLTHLVTAPTPCVFIVGPQKLGGFLEFCP